jgi:hypothetical protein
MSSAADIVNRIHVRSSQSNPLVVAVPEAAAHAYQAHAADRNAILRSRLNNQQQEFINALNMQTNEQLHKHKLVEGDSTHENTLDRDKILHRYGQEDTRDANINELVRLERLYGLMRENALSEKQVSYEMDRGLATHNNALEIAKAKATLPFELARLEKMGQNQLDVTALQGVNNLANTRATGEQVRLNTDHDARTESRKRGFRGDIDAMGDNARVRSSANDNSLIALHRKEQDVHTKMNDLLSGKVPDYYRDAKISEFLKMRGLTSLEDIDKDDIPLALAQIRSNISSGWAEERGSQLNSLTSQLNDISRQKTALYNQGAVNFQSFPASNYRLTDNGGGNDLNSNPDNADAGSDNVDIGGVFKNPEDPDAATVDHNYIGNAIHKATIGGTAYSAASSFIKGGQVKAFTEMVRRTPDFPTKISGAELDDIGNFAKNVLKGNNVTLPQGATNQQAVEELKNLLANDKKGARLLKSDKVLQKELTKLYQKHAGKKATGQMASLTGRVVAKAGLQGAKQMGGRLAGGLVGGPVGWGIAAASLLWFAYDIYKAHSDSKSATK